MSGTRRPLAAAGTLHGRVVELTALCAELERLRLAAEADYLAKSAAYDALVAERDMLKDDLAFVERWANHHARKPHVTPAQALGVIQHYPAISDITKSYADGVVPTTRNPWAELKEAQKALRAAVIALAHAAEANPSYMVAYLRVSDALATPPTAGREGEDGHV